MTVESATYIGQLATANPAGGDVTTQGDDHIRLLKSCLKNTFPKANSAINATAGAMNWMDGGHEAESRGNIGIYTGRVNTAPGNTANAHLPTGWTVTWSATGSAVITHNWALSSAKAALYFCASGEDAGAVNVHPIYNDANSFQLAARDDVAGGGAYIKLDCTFMVMRLE